MIIQNNSVKGILVVLIALFMVNTAIASTNVRVEKVNPFDEVRVFGLIEVDLVQGTKEKVTVKGGSANDVIIKNIGNTLKVQLRKPGIRNKIDVRITITYNEIYKVMASGGAKLNIEETIEGSRFEVTSKSGAKIALDVAMKSIVLHASEGGEITLSGQVKTQTIKIGSGGYLDSKKTISTETYININTGGRADVYAEEILDVNIRMGGKVFYRGNAQVNQNIVLGGSVEEVEQG